MSTLVEKFPLVKKCPRLQNSLPKVRHILPQNLPYGEIPVANNCLWETKLFEQRCREEDIPIDPPPGLELEDWRAPKAPIERSGPRLIDREVGGRRYRCLSDLDQQIKERIQRPPEIDKAWLGRGVSAEHVFYVFEVSATDHAEVVGRSVGSAE